MLSDYEIPMTLYNKLMLSICEEYDLKFKRLASISKNVVRNRYELPINEKKKTLRMGGVNVYIWKAPRDLFNIEYILELKINKVQFIKFVNSYMNKNGFKGFDFDQWMYQDGFLFNLSECITTKYNISTKTHIVGGYIQFEVKIFIHPSTKIIDM